MSRVTTTALAGFVVTAQTTADGGGNMTIPILDPITAVGAYQTVTNSPVNGSAITVYGNSGTVTTQGMAFHREAFALVSIPLPEPGGVDMVKTVTDEESGISFRILRAYDPQTMGSSPGWTPFTASHPSEMSGPCASPHKQEHPWQTTLKTSWRCWGL